MMKIRTGYSSDIASIMPIMAAAFDPQFGEAWTQSQCSGSLGVPGTSFFLVEKSGILIGFALFRTIVDESEVFLIAIHPDHQGQSAGRTLFEAVIAEAKRKGSTSLLVEVREDNPALSFYDSLNFVQIGKRSAYYKRTDKGPKGAITLVLRL